MRPKCSVVSDAATSSPSSPTELHTSRTGGLRGSRPCRVQGSMYSTARLNGYTMIHDSTARAGVRARNAKKMRRAMKAMVAVRNTSMKACQPSYWLPRSISLCETTHAGN